MRLMLCILCSLIVLLLLQNAQANEKTLNLCIWSDVIPDTVIAQFQKETGIKINFSTYDNNETLYTKLRTSSRGIYDLIEPSSYYIDRMRRQHMLEKIDKTQLSEYHNLNPALLLNPAYDPHSQYSVPFIWGVTGIFVNTDCVRYSTITRWSDLWNTRYRNQILILDDARDVFSIALRILGYSSNDSTPEHIKQAYLKLRQLIPNIKMYSDSTISFATDGDADIGMGWNGDIAKAKNENTRLAFVYPKDGFVIWVDGFAVPKNAPHRQNAYRFLNFIMRPDIAKTIALDNHYATANLAAERLLPDTIKHDPMIYPPADLLRHGEFQSDINHQAMVLYEQYWEQLKMEG